MADRGAGLTGSPGPTQRAVAFRMRVRYRLTPMWGRVLLVFVR